MNGVVDGWIFGLMRQWIDINKGNNSWGITMDYTKLRNRNRGYMKLEVWQKAIELHKMIWKAVYQEIHLDYKLRAQIADAAQPVSGNIAEGYSRRSIREYLQHLYISLGSLSEMLTRTIGLKVTEQLTEGRFNEIDTLHYEVENKLLRLVQSLEAKKDKGDWNERV